MLQRFIIVCFFRIFHWNLSKKTSLKPCLVIFQLIFHLQKVFHNSYFFLNISSNIFIFPPKGSEILVTKEDLILGLRNSLSCSAMFAPLAMPLYLEKLDSDLNGAKVDANLTMIQSLSQYSPSQIFPHLDELWGLLKKEILGIKMNVSEEVNRSCHQVIFIHFSRV